MSAPAPRPRAQVWILVAVFFVPLALAFLLYYGGGWRPGGSTNHGELISPPRPVSGDLWRGKWTLVYVGDGRCDGQCRAALVLMRQTRLALNDDMSRVQRVFLPTGNCCDRPYLDEQHPGLIVALADSEAGAALLATIPDAQPGTDGYIYIVDPLGNLMMRHAPAAPPAKGLLEDLRRLLKLSHIG
jgi:hypothetical protein